MFRFASTIRRYETPYELVRQGEGDYDSVGVYRPPEPQRTSLRGVIQPVSAKLLQLDGGRYTEDDRTLFTTFRHAEGDIIEHAGKQYTIDGFQDRSAYSDVHQYTMKRVSTHDPV
jgi:hypothetical protein